MDKLESLGLRIDESENLRIISDSTVQGSREISNKIKVMIQNLDHMDKSMDKSIASLESLEEITQNYRVLMLAERISKLNGS